MSPVTHTTRHNMVRDAIVQTIRQYGITTSSEPRCFTYQNDAHQRPDIMAHTKPQHVVTDVTLIHEHIDITLAEKNKHKTHSEACAKQGCIFIPFAMYTRGTLGQQAGKVHQHYLQGNPSFIAKDIQKRSETCSIRCSSKGESYHTSVRY